MSIGEAIPPCSLLLSILGVALPWIVGRIERATFQLMNATQRARKKARAMHFQKERERMENISSSDLRSIAQGHKDVLSRARAKSHKGECREFRERQFTSGFKGLVPATGKEMGGDYIPRLRVRDGLAKISQRAWVLRGVK